MLVSRQITGRSSGPLFSFTNSFWKLTNSFRNSLTWRKISFIEKATVESSNYPRTNVKTSQNSFYVHWYNNFVYHIIQLDRWNKLFWSLNYSSLSLRLSCNKYRMVQNHKSTLLRLEKYNYWYRIWLIQV